MAEAQMGREQRMLKGAIRTAAVIAFAGVIAVTAAPAGATVEFRFLVDTLTLDYDYEDHTEGDKYMEIQATADDSAMIGTLYDTVASSTIDGASFTADSALDFVLLLTFTRDGEDDWSATGTFSMLDITNTEVAQAAVDTTEVTIFESGALEYFRVSAILTPDSEAAILQTPISEPWTFVGDANAEVSDDGSDDTANQVSLSGWSGYNQGTILTTQFLLTPGWTPDTYLAIDQDESGGQASGTIVPVPPAVLLGFVGLCLAGWKIRKYA